MDHTPNLTLPYIMAAQAQKHVTHNEAVRMLDALVQLAVLDRDLTAPPGSPADGVRYIVAASPSGAWAGQAAKIAAWQDGAWEFFTPRSGFVAWVSDEARLVIFDGSSWVLSSGGLADPTPKLGINTASDTTNRLAVKSDAVLLSHDDVTPGSGDTRAKINKSATGKVASTLYQMGFSMRAEIGLVGNDSFSFKVSPDGTTIYTPLVLGSDASITFDGQNPNNSAAIVFQKQRSTTNSYRFNLDR